jgi:hypothetical protein
MPGPLPARAAARRNRPATAATLLPGGRARRRPRLPNREDGWHELTIAWWRDVWASPMAPEYDDSDVHGLLLLAVLVDQFWRVPSKELAAEIRLQRQCYGLTPIDRRRLQWTIERADDAKDRASRRRPKPAETKPAEPAAVPGDDVYGPLRPRHRPSA